MFSASRQLMFYASVERDGLVEASKIQSDKTPGLMMGEWTHVAMTFNEGKVAFYYNGEPVGEVQSMPDGMTSVTAIADLGVGMFRGLVSSPGISHLDDFGFFAETVLSPAEIARIYEKGLMGSGVLGSVRKDR